MYVIYTCDQRSCYGWGLPENGHVDAFGKLLRGRRFNIDDTLHQALMKSDRNVVFFFFVWVSQADHLPNLVLNKYYVIVNIDLS